MSTEALPRLWDNYAQAGYENIYLVRITNDHRERLGQLLLPSNNGICLDAGCGTGNMFELILRRIQPSELHAVDWSQNMLAKSKKEAERLREISNTDFRFYLSDISSSLPLDDRMCDVVVANLLICYVTCGWQRAIQEMARVLKTGGYIYLGTLLENWGFISVLWKHAPVEFIRAPLESFRGLKYRSIVHDISKELTKSGAVFPSRKELAQFMELIGFEEMYIVPTYWGGGLALRARLH